MPLFPRPPTASDDAAAPASRQPSLAFSLSYGAFALGLVSVAAYSLWAFRLIRGDGLLYAVIALVYLGLGGLALNQLVLGRGTALRFAALFAGAFLLYAIAWCAFWFGLRGKYQADLWGALVGLAAMSFLIARAFGNRSAFLSGFVVLFALHSAGYYAGDALHAAVGRSTGRLLWGAAHGLGFGAGLGYLLYRVQSPARASG